MNQILTIVQLQYLDTTATNTITYFRGESWTSTRRTAAEASSARPTFEAIPLGPIGSSGEEVKP